MDNKTNLINIDIIHNDDKIKIYLTTYKQGLDKLINEKTISTMEVILNKVNEDQEKQNGENVNESMLDMCKDILQKLTKSLDKNN